MRCVSEIPGLAGAGGKASKGKKDDAKGGGKMAASKVEGAGKPWGGKAGTQGGARKGGVSKGGLRRKCAAFLRVEVPGDADKDALEAVDALMSLSSGYGNRSPNLHSAFDALPSLSLNSKAFNAALEALCDQPVLGDPQMDLAALQTPQSLLTGKGGSASGFASFFGKDDASVAEIRCAKRAVYHP